MSPQEIKITELGKIPEWSNMFEFQDEAIIAATKRKQSYYFYCDMNHTYYVASEQETK